MGSSWSGWSRVSGSTPSAPTSTIRDYRLFRNATLFDDFETYSVGEFPSGGGWVIEWETGGSPEASVSDSAWMSYSRSFKIRDYRVSNPALSSISAKYIGYDIWINVSENLSPDGYTKISLTESGILNEDAAVIFEADGDIVAGGTVIGSWTPKRFTHIRVLLNREESNPSFIVWVNGSLYESSFSTSQPPQKLQLFDAIAIEVSDQITYVDDVRVFFLENR